MRYTITVNRGAIEQHGPAIRIEEAGVEGERYCHEVHIMGPSRIGYIRGRRVAVETDADLEEGTHG